MHRSESGWSWWGGSSKKNQSPSRAAWAENTSRSGTVHLKMSLQGSISSRVSAISPAAASSGAPHRAITVLPSSVLSGRITTCMESRGSTWVMIPKW